MTLDDIADRWFRQLWQQGDWEGLDRLHAPHFVDRTPGPGRAPDNAGFEAFPDAREERGRGADGPRVGRRPAARRAGDGARGGVSAILQTS